MKTTGFKTLVLGTPWRNLTYCIIETDEGITGIGEARVLGKTHTVTQYLKDVERHFIGHDPFDIEALYRRMTLEDFGKPGEVVYTGLALVELAFWDIIGKSCNQPVYKLLGGQVKDKVQAYANGWYTVERSPEQYAAAAEKVLDKGYKAMKFDPFGNGDLELERPEFYRSLDLIEAVATVAGTQAQIMIEMHGRFAPLQAREIARFIEKYNIGWIEEPARRWDFLGLKKVSDALKTPVCAGENLDTLGDFLPYFHHRSADVIQVSHGMTGITGALQIADAAYGLELPVTLGGSAGILHAHIASAIPNCITIEIPHPEPETKVYKWDVKIENGLAVLGDKPGHGITIDYEELNKSVVNKISVKSGPSPYGRRAGAGLYEVPPTKDEIKEANSK